MKATSASLFLAFCLFPVFLAMPQNRLLDSWTKGTVYLKDGSKSEGELLYSEKHQALQFRFDGRIEAIPAHNIDYFAVFDSEINLDRYYVPLSIQLKNNRAAFELYELILSGPLNLLRTSETRVVTQQGFQTNGYFEYRNVTTHEYFIYKDDRLWPIKNFEKDLLPMFNRYQSEVMRFIEEENLSTRRIEGQLQAIAYYNNLVK